MDPNGEGLRMVKEAVPTYANKSVREQTKSRSRKQQKQTGTIAITGNV